jgi:hypothetical protein
MAQSWLRLAQHADRVNLVPEDTGGDEDQEIAQETVDAPQTSN